MQDSTEGQKFLHGRQAAQNRGAEDAQLGKAQPTKVYHLQQHASACCGMRGQGLGFMVQGLKPTPCTWLTLGLGHWSLLMAWS